MIKHNLGLSRLLLLSVFIFHLPFSYQYLFTGNEIRDLFKFGSCFSIDSAYWNATKLVSSSKTSYCNGYPLLGGYHILGDPTTSVQINEYFSRAYSNLPSHTYIYYTMTIYAIDSWEDTRADNDRIQLSFDTTNIIAISGLDSSRFSESLCGTTTVNDLRNLRIFGRVSHNLGTLTLKITSLLGEVSTNESFGFREVNLLFSSPSTAPGNAVCAYGPGPTVLTTKCTCDEGWYDASGTCTACHANCASCFGSSANQCYQCKPGYSWIGGSCTACNAACSVCHGTAYNQCDECNQGFYLFNRTQCVVQCDLPLSQGNDGCSNTCTSPCSNTSDYIYWDGSCQSTCNFPLHASTLLGALKGCTYPCTSSQYLLSSGKCSSTCTAPLITTSVAGRKLCTFPCATGEYLYWNSTCSAQCTFPLTQTTTDGNLYCGYSCTGTNYLYWNGSCKGTCDAPLISRTEGGMLFCDFPTQELTKYLYWDGSVSATCALPLNARTEGSPLIRKFCDFKCTGTNYLYWNGSCLATCSFPLQTQVLYDKNFCIYPCQSTESLYWDGTCKASCDYNPRVEAGNNYCDFQCSSSNYLYWDSTCLPTCSPPLTTSAVTTIGGKSCTYGCQSAEYLYWNGTCKSTCDFPLTASSLKGKKFCNYPCNLEDFLYYNGSCLSNCQLPLVSYKVSGRSFCDYPCSSNQYLFWNGTCLNSCNSPLTVISGAFGEKYCNLPCPSPLDYYDSKTGLCAKQCSERSVMQDGMYFVCLPPVPDDDIGLIDEFLIAETTKETSLLVVPQITQYVKYLKIQEPPRLAMLTASKARAIFFLRFGISMSDSLRGWVTKQRLPQVYERTGLHSSFFVNYWNDFTSLAIIFLTALPLIILTAVLKRTKMLTIHSFLDKLKVIFKWNFCLMLLAVHVGDIMLFAALDFRTAKFDNPSAPLSIVNAIAMITATISFFINSGVLIKRYNRIKASASKSGEPEAYLKKWESWQVVLHGYKEYHWIPQSFYIIYIMRLLLAGLLAGSMDALPQTQTVCQLIMNLMIIGLVFYTRPIKKKINQTQLLIMEGLYFVINLSAFLTATFDKAGLTNSKTRIFFGDTIVITSLIANIIPQVFLAIKIVDEFSTIYKFQKMQMKKDRSVWIRLLVIPLQQAAFGFEEILDDIAVLPEPVEKTKLLRSPNGNLIQENSDLDEKTLNKMIAKPYLALGSDGEFSIPSASPLNDESPTKIKFERPDRLDRLRTLKKKGLQIPSPTKEHVILEELKEDTVRMASPTDLTATTFIKGDQNQLSPKRRNYNNDYEANYNFNLAHANNENNNYNSNFLDGPSLMSIGAGGFRDVGVNDQETAVLNETSPLRRVMLAHEEYEREQKQAWQPPDAEEEEETKDNREARSNMLEKFGSRLRTDVKSKTQAPTLKLEESSLVLENGSQVLRTRNLGRSMTKAPSKLEGEGLNLD